MDNVHLEQKPTKPLRYAIGMFGTSIPINMFKTYAAIFYVDRLGVTTKQFALVLFIYTFLDAIDNPVYGFLSDGTRGKWGRRRPWLVIGAPLLALSFIMFYNVPASIGQGSVFWYLLVMYMLTGTLDSLINANYGALFPELFHTEAERSRTNALRQVFQFLAMIISIALTPIVTEKIGYSMTSIVYSVLAVAVILYMAFGCHEDPNAQNQPRPKLFQAVWQIIRNPKFWEFGVTNAAFFAAEAIALSAVPFYTKYWLKVGGLGSTIMQGTAIVAVILSIPLWVRIIRKWTLMPCWRAAFLCVCLGFVPLYFTHTLVSSTIALLLFAFGVGGVSVTMDVVSARILDEDTARYGIKREGTFGSLMGILNKASGLFSSLAFLLMYSLYGFESGDNPGPAPDSAARFMMSLFPFAVMVVCFAVSFLVRFDKKPAEPQA